MADQRYQRQGSRPAPGGGRGGPERAPGPPDSLRDIFPDYLKQGYFDGTSLREELIRRATMDRLAKAMAFSRPGLTSNQARRFFQHCRAIEANLRVGQRAGQDRWPDEKANVLKLDEFAAEARNKQKVPAIFEEFIRRNIDTIHGARDFTDGFMPHFEALIAFGSAYLRDRG